MTYDLAVIGGGFWGVTTAKMARYEGLDVVLLDNNRATSGSRNAAGICHPDWYKGKTIKKILPPWLQDKKEIDFSIDWLRGHSDGGFLKTGMDIELLYGKKTESYKQNVWMMDDPIGYLHITPSVKMDILKIERNKGSGVGSRIIPVDEKENEPIYAKKIVLAAGSWTDRILERSGFSRVGVGGLFGRYFLTRFKQKLTTPIELKRSPYLGISIRQWGKNVRVGDTVEKKRDLKYIGPIIETIYQKYKVYPMESEFAYEYAGGYRPVCPNGVVVKEVATDLVVATGGHRVGMGLSAAVARKSLQLLGLL